MITDIQKKEIDIKYFPNGFFWQTENFDPQSYLRALRQPFESLELYDSSVKSLRNNNALRFFWTIEKMNKTDFISEINSQYLNYTIENMKNAELWLSHTYDIVLKGVGYSQKINDTKLRAAFIEWHKSKLNELKPRQTNNNDESKEPQHLQSNNLHELITSEHCKEIVEAVRIQYKNIKGKKLKLLLLAFQNLKLIPIERTASKFHKCCKNEFNWDIATYPAMNDYEYNSQIDKKELDSMISFLDKTIRNHK
ncbi:hypothetical protein SAMN05428642_101888 [Flaviramulus basaltis]|uniref:Uncharacterized protein n=1 Tax=Flaviramulus basaltis TaxID=369401 RepID=A0A1K2IF73_9FLAO|nr:hypothetical protein [Flaviramulus basaltis]SFZ90355.1 hypothetical protein SAMN05428642_101888 [Flaviramulus basaltis]